jgi:serine/threonine kinase 16
LKLFRGVCVALEQLHYHKLAAVPTTRRVPNMEEEPLMDGEAAAAAEEEEAERGLGEIVPYAHRDIKPGHNPL